MRNIYIPRDTLFTQQINGSIFNRIVNYLKSIIGQNEEQQAAFSNKKPIILSNENMSIPSAPKDEWKIRMINHWKQLENLSQDKIESLHIYSTLEEAQEFKRLIENHQIQAVTCLAYNAA